ncbi:unnamed protein product [Ceutorhynchus assimilis]|uniref:Uncharacterized protein n=1 Tax=Ceutorhynchus assimilis TaxID=467358 RepID=A0A9N9QQG4_9CUCU|nr:unnamed protein product [Ceutorhynchus assimilis]
MVKFNLVTLVLVAGCGFASAFVPEYIHICHRNDPEVAECIKNSVEALRPRLIQGIPELDVPGLDPLKIKKIVIFDGAQTPNLDASLSNVVAHGAGNFKITTLKLDVEKKTYRVGVKIPSLQMEGDYDIDAKILVTPIKSKGHFHANATDIDGQALIQGDVNNNRFKFQSIAFKIKIGDFNLDMDNLLSDDPVLMQAARQLFNGNKQDLISLATPYIERKCSEVLLDLSNKITEKFTYDEAFPL